MKNIILTCLFLLNTSCFAMHSGKAPLSLLSMQKIANSFSAEELSDVIDKYFEKDSPDFPNKIYLYLATCIMFSTQQELAWPERHTLLKKILYEWDVRYSNRLSYFSPDLDIATPKDVRSTLEFLINLSAPSIEKQIRESIAITLSTIPERERVYFRNRTFIDINQAIVIVRSEDEAPIYLSTLRLAISEGLTALVNTLLMLGADPNDSLLIDDRLPPPLIFTFWLNRDTIAQLLIDYGAYTENLKEKKWDPLIFTAGYNMMQFTALLIKKYNVDVNGQFSTGTSVDMPKSLVNFTRVDWLTLMLKKENLSKDQRAFYTTALTNLQKLGGVSYLELK